MKFNMFFVHEYEYHYEHRSPNIESVSIRRAIKDVLDF
jgi:hypothetical protein